jgi:hypothetical protein
MTQIIQVMPGGAISADMRNEQILYYKRFEAEEAMRIIAKSIAQNPKVKIVYHSQAYKRVYADLETGELHIPVAANQSGITKESIDILRAHVYHESGHLIETDFDQPMTWYAPLDIKAKAALPSQKKAEALGIVADPTPLELFFAECRTDRLLKPVWNAIEDVRMERIIGDRYPGCGLMLAIANTYYNKKIALDFAKDEMEFKDKAPEKRAKTSLWEAMCALSFTFEGYDLAWTMCPQAQVIYDCVKDLFYQVRDLKSNDGSIQLAKDILNKLRSETSIGEQEAKDNEEREKKGEKKKRLHFILPGKNPNPDEDEDPTDGPPPDVTCSYKDDEPKDGGGGGGGGGPGTGNDSDDDADVIVIDMTEQEEGLAKDDAINETINTKLNLLATKECHYTALRDNDIHTFADETNMESDRENVNAMRQALGGSTMNLINGLHQALLAIQNCKESRYLRSGQIDKRRLVQIGKHLSQEVFKTVQPGIAMDTCVSLVVDESGSMDHRMAEARNTVLALADTMTRLNIPFEITGTSTVRHMGQGKIEGFTRWVPIHYRHYKLFAEDWRRVFWRLNHMTDHNSNVDGEALEYCAMRMRDRKETRKIIISICDGEPCASQGTESDKEMGFNLKRVATRLRSAGYEVYGFGVNTTGPEQYYGKDWFFNLKSTKNMSSDFIRKMSTILIRGQLSRRA